MQKHNLLPARPITANTKHSTSSCDPHYRENGGKGQGEIGGLISGSAEADSDHIVKRVCASGYAIPSRGEQRCEVRPRRCPEKIGAVYECFLPFHAMKCPVRHPPRPAKGIRGLKSEYAGKEGSAEFQVSCRRIHMSLWPIASGRIWGILLQSSLLPFGPKLPTILGWARECWDLKVFSVD